MNLLVTGGHGFIGSNLIRHIIDQPEIERLVNLDCLTYAGNPVNLESVSNHPKYVFELVDLRDKDDVRSVVERHAITHVMHLAAESHVDRSITGPDDFIHTNIVGTFNLLEACRSNWRDTEGRRFLHVSTDEVYGSLGPIGKFTEESPYAPNSPYSASKAAADMLVRAYHRTYGFPAIITNCSNNYGPYQFPEKLIPVIIKACLKREPIPIYGTGLNSRDWIHVLDHAESLWQVLARGSLGESYNIGGGNETTNLELAGLICDLVDEEMPSLGNSRKLITFVQDRPGHDWRYAVDDSKLRLETGWSPQLDFKEGLRQTIRFYLNA